MDDYINFCKESYVGEIEFQKSLLSDSIEWHENAIKRLLMIEKEKINEQQAQTYLEIIKKCILLPEGTKKDALWKLIGKTTSEENELIHDLKTYLQRYQIINMLLDSNKIDFKGESVYVLEANTWLNERELKKTNGGRDLDKLGIYTYISHPYDKKVFKRIIFETEIQYTSISNYFLPETGVINVLHKNDVLEFCDDKKLKDIIMKRKTSTAKIEINHAVSLKEKDLCIVLK